ncbi:TetR/AcrR family transcriptional regulator [Fertoebacter nigrum]|uniref:TetR/AcrR family transcriptional regulator n=1 Tax=Fertoeibacter niger TaxID=2656921 RepID=A0A8X8GVV8_9RHOB|nr:TetR/AcrR family transcriptional regulator [Fertoeibacter niger]
MQLKPQKKAETRQRILEAADILSAELGANHLSLDAVAARAGISKGGLLYHFPSKHDLLRGLVAQHVDGIRADMQAQAPGCLGPEGPALAGARAYLAVSRRRICRMDATLAGVLAAMAEDAGFLAPMLAFRTEVEALFRRCPDPAQAELVFLATQGIVQMCMTDADRYTTDDLHRLFDLLDAQLLAGQTGRQAALA